MGSEVPCLWSPGGVGGNWVLTVLMLVLWSKLDMAERHYFLPERGVVRRGSLALQSLAPSLGTQGSVCSHVLLTYDAIASFWSSRKALIGDQVNPCILQSGPPIITSSNNSLSLCFPYPAPGAQCKMDQDKG